MKNWSWQLFFRIWLAFIILLGASLITAEASAQEACMTPYGGCPMGVMLPPGSPCQCSGYPGIMGQVVVVGGGATADGYPDEEEDTDPPPQPKHKKKRIPNEEEEDQ